MLTIHVWPKRLKEFLLTHPLYKSPCNSVTGLINYKNYIFPIALCGEVWYTVCK